jgi:putative protease
MNIPSKHPPNLELLTPAGNPEKLEIAIHYGADAVYLGGKGFSLRHNAGNFSPEEMKRAVAFARERGVRVYVTCNVFPRTEELERLRDYLEQLGTIGPDGLIVADPGVFALARGTVPEIPIHVSTQANVTHLGAARFWREMGARRVNVARELSLTEIREIAAGCGVKVEAFVHGAMCMAYSGRCLLSSAMAGRDGNRGDCCQPCRSRYAIVDERRPGHYFPIREDDRGGYILSSRDLCMIDHIPEMAASGIRAFKIEGRAKSIHYLATVVNVYRQALDAFRADPESYSVLPEWRSELELVGQRGYTTGFYLGEPHALGPQEYPPEPKAEGTAPRFAGKVLGMSEDGWLWVQVRNKIRVGDGIQLLRSRELPREAKIEGIRDSKGLERMVGQPGEVLTIRIQEAAGKNDLIRVVGPNERGKLASS